MSIFNTPGFPHYHGNLFPRSYRSLDYPSEVSWKLLHVPCLTDQGLEKSGVLIKLVSPHNYADFKPGWSSDKESLHFENSKGVNKL